MHKIPPLSQKNVVLPNSFVLAGSFVLGILAHTFLHNMPAMVALIGIMALCTPLLTTKRALLIFLCGLTLAPFKINWQQKCYRINVASIRKKHWFIATVQDIEHIAGAFAYKTVVQLADNKSAPFVSAAQVAIYSKNKPHLFPGDRIKMNAVTILQPPDNDYGRYLEKESIAGTAFIYNYQPSLIKRPIHSLARIRWQLRNALYTSIKQASPPTTFALISLIFFGNKNIDASIKNPLKERFKLWGISHYLARSGLHLVLLISICHVLLSITPLSIASRYIVSLGLVSAYALLSWPSVSFYRALICYVLHGYTALCKRKPSYLNVLSWACFFTLFSNPHHIFFLDFQLSYGATLAILIMRELLFQSSSHEKKMKKLLAA